MPNVLFVGFGQSEYERILRVADERVTFRAIDAVDDLSAAACCDELAFAAALVRWSGAVPPTPSQVKLLKYLQDHRVPSIVVCGGGLTAETKLAALEAGAVDCLEIMICSARLRLLLDLFVSRGAARETQVTKRQRAAGGPELIANSPQMMRLLTQLARVAPLCSTVLLTGETGVGKTTLARWIHDTSDRRQSPFMTVPCAAIPSPLLESELFGHMRGAFSGADRDHKGRFEAVAAGTLLLDEVDCLPLELQAKLLRAVEQRAFEPLGSTVSLRLDARLIVASNRPLEQLIETGAFRPDLYYRLQILSFRVPPLRECPESIISLAEHFCRQFARQHGRPVDGLTPSVKRALLAYPWPGNVRELKNAMDRAVALADGRKIQWIDLPDNVRFGSMESHPATPSTLTPGDGRASTGNHLHAARDEAERRLLIESLDRNNQNRSRTAADLGISRVTLYKRMDRLGIQPSS